VDGAVRGLISAHLVPVGRARAVLAAEFAAAARFRAAGVEPVRVSANAGIASALMQFSAGLHCLCGPLP